LKFSVIAEVSGLEGIADPEGQTIERALPLLGFAGIGHVRVGKVFRFTLEAPDVDSARHEAEELCDRLLANPVIERSAVVIEPAGTVAISQALPPADSPGGGDS
jgi:phosphoribosylformylglycinamidine synthase PurS subunit